MKPRLMSSLCSDIKLALSRSGMSKREFAEKLHVHPAYVTKIVSGKQNFTIDTLRKIAEALECDLRIEMKQKTPTKDK